MKKLYWVPLLVLMVALFTTAIPLTTPVSARPAAPLSEYPLNSGYNDPSGAIRGPDGNVWFVEYANPGYAIARISPSGLIADFPVPGVPVFMTAGPDGNIWYTRFDTGAVSKMTLAGTVTTYSLPAGSLPVGITAGPDGNVWITDYTRNQILRVTTAGNLTGQFPIPTSNSEPYAITAGEDSTLWFAETHAGKIGRILTTGTITEFSIPSGISLCQGDLVARANGDLWFCTNPSNAITYMTSQGLFGTISYQTSEALFRFAVDSDDNVWALTGTSDKIYFNVTLYRIGPFGSVSPITTMSSSSPSVAVGGDGRIWLTKSPYPSSPSASIVALDPSDFPLPYTTMLPLVAR